MNRTETRIINRTKYCIYCTEKSKRDSEGSNHNNDYVEFDVCNCRGSKKALELKAQIDQLWVDIEDLPRIHEYKLNKMQYDFEVGLLREKWAIPAKEVENE